MNNLIPGKILWVYGNYLGVVASTIYYDIYMSLYKVTISGRIEFVIGV